MADEYMAEGGSIVAVSMFIILVIDLNQLTDR